MPLAKGEGAMSWNETIDNYLYDEIIDIYKYLHRWFASIWETHRMLNFHKVVFCNKLILNNSYLQVSVLLLSALLQDIETVTIFAPANKKLVNV